MREEHAKSLRYSEQKFANSLLIQDDRCEGDKTGIDTVISAEATRSPESCTSERDLTFVRYSSIGGFATAVHYAVLMLLVEWFYMSPSLAATSGTACGALIAYAGNRQFTFASRSHHRIALPRFLIVAVLGVVLNGAIVWAGTEALSWHYMVAQVVATLCVLLITYRLNRSWAFI